MKKKKKGLTPFGLRKKIGERWTMIKRKRSLQGELKRLNRELAKIKKFPDYGTSEDANVMEAETFGERVSLEKKMTLLIEKTQKALKKIDEGTYGSCEICHKPIEGGRLKIFPSATECAVCANQKSKK